MKSTIKSLFSKSNELPLSVRERLEVLIDSDITTQLVAEDERRRLARRADLAKRLAELPKQHAKAVASAAQAEINARAAHEMALDGARKAFDVLAAAGSASFAASYGYDSDVSHIKRELVETADRRITDFIFELRQAKDNARNAIACWIDSSQSWLGRAGHVARSNTEYVLKALEIIDKCDARCVAMQLEALSSNDVMAELSAMVITVENAMTTLQLHGPVIKDGEVVRSTRDMAPHVTLRAFSSLPVTPAQVH